MFSPLLLAGLFLSTAVNLASSVHLPSAKADAERAYADAAFEFARFLDVLPESRSEEDADVITAPTANSSYARVVLKAHSKARAKLGADRMMLLTWDQALADLAAKHANKCNYTHGDLELPDGTRVGQNLARAHWSEDLGVYPPDKHVENWVLESKYFNFRTSTCEEMGDCGHYSQLIWARTSKVGCAHKVCPNLHSDMIVCNYSPFGNEPGPAYEVWDAPCSRCNLKGGTACVDNQCVDCEQHPERVGEHKCKQCDPDECKDNAKGECDKILDRVCTDQMYESFAKMNCIKFCKFCPC